MRAARYSGAHSIHAKRAAPVEPSRRRKPPPARRRLSKRMRFLLAAVAAALLLGAAALILTPAETGLYEANMSRALEAWEQADWERALQHLRLASALDESDDCLLLMASCYEQLGNLDKALELLRRADPNDSETAQRILSLESRRAQQKSAERIELFGMQLSRDCTALEADNRGLRDADLEQITVLYALDSLSLRDNDLVNVSALCALGSLDELDLSGNLIRSTAALGRMTQLRSLTLDGNPLEDVSPLAALVNLRTLSLRRCALSVDALQALAEALPGCAILSDSEDAACIDIRLGGLAFRSDVRELNLSGCGIRDIGVIAVCKELQWLNLSDNALTDLQGLMNLPRLGNLDISGNQIVDLRPLIGLTTLRTLKAADNAIVDLSPLSAMTWLQSLDLSRNPISDFSALRRLTSLGTLRLNETGLRDADLDYLGALTQLGQLSIEDNPGLTNEAYGQLQSRLRGCAISHSALIYTIQIENRSVRSDVMQLDLSGEGIADLSGLERLTNLESLNLSRNRISNLYLLQISASRGTLKSLNLSFNEIRSVASLAELGALENLNLYGNPLESASPLLRLGKLRTLNVGGCGLSDKQIQELREGLPDCTVTLDAG